jgi:hypothetical protein
MDLSKLQLSKHFIIRFQERVGGVPGTHRVTKILQKSLKVQSGKKYNTLSIYVNFSEGIVIYIDDRKKFPIAVTVRSNKQEIKPIWNKRQYIPMTSHTFKKEELWKTRNI